MLLIIEKKAFSKVFLVLYITTFKRYTFNVILTIKGHCDHSPLWFLIVKWQYKVIKLTKF